MPREGSFRDAVIELKDFIQVKVSTEEKFKRKIEKLKQKRTKDKNELKEIWEYVRILKEEVQSLKESHEELKSKFQETQKEGCAEVNQYDASPSQRSQLSQSIRYRLVIENAVSNTIYKRERVETVDGAGRIKVVMYDGVNQIASYHPLASARVHLVVIEGWFNEGKPTQGTWSKEEFEKSIVQPRKGITRVVKNGTFDLVDGSCSHEGAIIMDNSQQREFKLGVMIAVHTEERVLEGVSNPFKVQEGRTKSSKKKVQKPSSLVPTRSLVQPTSIHGTQHDQGLVSQGEQHSLPPPVIQGLLQKQDCAKHKQFPSDDTAEDNRPRSYSPATMPLSAAPVDGNGQALYSNGQQMPMQFLGQSTSAQSMQYGLDSLPAPIIQRSLQAAEDNRLSCPPATMPPIATPVDGNGQALYSNGQQMPMQFLGQSTSAQSMQHGLDSLPAPIIQRSLQASEDNRLRSCPPATMPPITAPIDGNGQALYSNGQQMPMQFLGQSTSAQSMQHGLDSLPAPIIQRSLQASEDNRLRSCPPATMPPITAPVDGNGQALYSNGQQMPMQFLGQSTSAQSMQHGLDSLPAPIIQRLLQASEDNRLRSCPPATMPLITAPVDGNGQALYGNGQGYSPPQHTQHALQAAGNSPTFQIPHYYAQCSFTSYDDASPELDEMLSAYRLNGLQIGQWNSTPEGESVEDVQHSIGQKQNQEAWPFRCGQVLLLWDKPDVELRQRFNFLDQLIPPYSTHRESFPCTSLIYKAHKLLASVRRTSPHRRGILIPPIEPYYSDDEPPVKKQRHAKYQLRFVNRVCNDYYTREQIKSDDGSFLKVALYDENNLVVTSGPLSSASVEVVLLHGDFNVEGQDNWTSEEFNTFLVCPQSVKEPPAMGGDRVLVLIDGEADLGNINFQNSSFHARTGKFKMGAEIKDVREERVQEGITGSFLVRSRQGEGGLSKKSNVGCGGYGEVYKENKNIMVNKLQDTCVMPMKLSYKLLKEITDNFSNDHIVGSGTYGVVYKGVLKTGKPIAVKKLYQNLELDNEEFENEFTRLMRIKHKNIVRLIGYTEERTLCFEYLPGGNLNMHISDELSGWDWHMRYNIIKGISEGLNYLHSNGIIHMDLKPANILLDKNMVPKIGDFGLPRFFHSKHSSGTLGYMPPEYIAERKISNKLDVFSLGVIIIKIITGRTGYCKIAELPSHKFIGEVHENWRKRLQRATMRHAAEQVQQVQTCIELALKCAEADRVKRPTITEIVDQLNKIDTANSSSGPSYISALEKQDGLCGQQHRKMETQGDTESEEEQSQEELGAKEELYLKPDHEVMQPAEEELSQEELVAKEELYLKP